MPFQMTEEELRHVEVISEDGLRDLALELGIPLRAGLARRDLLVQCVAALALRAAREGLPFSEYARGDLVHLPPPWRRALTRQLGLADDLDALIRAGQKVYRTYLHRRADSPLPLFLPILLPMLCRYLAEEG